MATISSPASTTQSLIPTASDWWIKAPTNAALNMVVKVFEWTPTRMVRAAVLEPTGRTRPVVLRGPQYGDQGSLGVRTLSSTEAASLEALIASKETLLLQNGIGEQWYFEISGDFTRNPLKSPATEANFQIRHAYEYTIPITEVDAPA